MKPSPKSTPAEAEFPVSAEACANCWYVMDGQGFIFALRVMLYVCSGSEAEKLAFLRTRAYLDYLVARDFAVPPEFRTTIVGPDADETTWAVIHHNDAARLGMEKLFWPALDSLAREQDSPSRVGLPESPLIKTTALVADEGGRWLPADALPPQ